MQCFLAIDKYDQISSHFPLIISITVGINVDKEGLWDTELCLIDDYVQTIEIDVCIVWKV